MAKNTTTYKHEKDPVFDALLEALITYAVRRMAVDGVMPFAPGPLLSDAAMPSVRKAFRKAVRERARSLRLRA